MSNNLQGLYTRRVDLKDMILRATTNGEEPNRIEILESELSRIDSLIDDENIRLYMKGEM